MDHILTFDGEDSDDSQGSRRPRSKCWTPQKCICGIVVVSVAALGIALLVICQGDQNKPTSELGGPRAGQYQQLVQEPNGNLSSLQGPRRLRILEALAYLKNSGLDFYLQASNSSCPPGICRECTKKIYIDPHRNIIPPRVCGRVNRVKNASCLLCPSPRSGPHCLTFREVLEDDICRHHTPSCCEKARMADLNNYCNRGSAVCESGALKCKCPLGKQGDRCQEEDESVKVLCECYDKRINLVEDLTKHRNCNSVYYSENVTCTFESIQKEHCFCTAEENIGSISDMTSCNDYDPEKRRAKRNTSNEADHTQRPLNTGFILVLISISMMSDQR